MEREVLILVDTGNSLWEDGVCQSLFVHVEVGKT